jgi:hypothetical protein
MRGPDAMNKGENGENAEDVTTP